MPDPNTAPSTDVADDLRAELTSAFEAQESTPSGSSGPDVATSSPAGAAQPSASSPPEGAAGGERTRNPDGTFAKGGKPAPAPAAQPGTQPVQGAAQPGQPQAQPAAPAGFQIPEKWPADVKAKLQAIHAVNPEHAQFVLDQYNVFRAIAGKHQAQTQEHLKAYEQYLAPTRQERALRGVDDGTHIKQVLAGDDFMRKNPEAGIRWLAQTHGVDLSKLGNPQADGAPEIPPYVAELQKEVQQLRAVAVQQARGVEEHQLQAASSWIDSFARQTDPQGQPLYPHFDEVLPEIIYDVQHQMQSGQQPNVTAAYHRAVRLNDQVWLKDQRARSEAAEKAAKAQRQRDIEDAKRAGVTVSGSGADTTHAPGSVREELERAFGASG